MQTSMSKNKFIVRTASIQTLSACLPNSFQARRKNWLLDVFFLFVEQVTRIYDQYIDESKSLRH